MSQPIYYKTNYNTKEKVDSVYRVSETAILGFFKEHRFLSNFHVCDILYEGKWYHSTEAAYQAAKSLDNTVREKFQEITAPSESRKEGKKIAIRSDWEQVKDQVMYDVNLYKYTQYPELKKLLLETADKHLEEANWWKDVYWGTYNGEGKNQLGKTLMAIRKALKTAI